MVSALLFGLFAAAILMTALFAVRHRGPAGFLLLAGVPVALAGATYLTLNWLGFAFVLPLMLSVGMSAVLTVVGLRRTRRAFRGRSSRALKVSLLGATLVAATPLDLALGYTAWTWIRWPESSTSARYRRMEVDPGSLVVRLTEPLSERAARMVEHFFRFRAATLTSVDHYGVDTGGERTRYNAFTLDLQGHLSSRTKYQRLLRGEFGTVYLETRRYYGERYAGHTLDLWTHGYFNALEHEPPRELVPESEEGLLPDALALIRILSIPQMFLVVSADYDATGGIRALHVNAARGGDWVHTNEIGEPYRQQGVGTMIGDRPGLRALYGLPERLPASALARGPVEVFGPTPLARYLDVVNLYATRLARVQQYLWYRDRGPEVRRLDFRITEQDRTLAARDLAASDR